MSRRRYTTEEILAKLQEALIEHAKGRTIPEICTSLGISPRAAW